jgi:hypothetical protein
MHLFYSLEDKSYALQSYKTLILGNAGIWTMLISLALKAGLNLTSYSLINVVGRFGSIGILVLLSYE